MAAFEKGVNSYVTVADAATHIALTRLSATWTNLDAAVKENYLMLATTLLDQLVEWYGWTAEEEQNLMWPREGVVRWRGYGYLDNDETPVEIEMACAWFAAELAAEPGRLADQKVEDLDIRALPGGLRFGENARRKPIPASVADLINGTGYGCVPDPDEARVVGVARA